MSRVAHIMMLFVIMIAVSACEKEAVRESVSAALKKSCKANAHQCTVYDEEKR